MHGWLRMRNAGRRRRSADKIKNEQKTAGEKMKGKLSPEERTHASGQPARRLKEKAQAQEKLQADAEAEANQIMLQLAGDPRSELADWRWMTKTTSSCASGMIRRYLPRHCRRIARITWRWARTWAFWISIAA